MNRIEDYYEKALKKLGYTLIRTGLKRGACKLETPIAISKQFELITYEAINLNDVAKLHGDHGAFLQCDTGVICLLKHKPSGKLIVIGNTHLDYHPSRDFVKYT